VYTDTLYIPNIAKIVLIGYASYYDRHH
jgi:hypothetical protein